MKILALEFSSPQRSVAVLNTGAGGRVIASHELVDASPGNSFKPLGMIEQALRETGLEREQIECIAIGLGPGSYTGIRASIALAQGWQLASGVKLLGLSSVECLAAQHRASGTTGRFTVVIDAQRDELYLAGFEIVDGELRQTSPLRLGSIVEAQACELAGALAIGPEAGRWFPQGRIMFPSAAELGQLAIGRTDFVPGPGLAPIYLREANFVKAPPPHTF